MTKIHPPMNAIQDMPEPGKPKPIEFTHSLNKELAVINPRPLSRPDYFSNLRLISKGAGGSLDAIAAWDDWYSESPIIYLGHWNDGVVA